ncbi:hypothetical protein ACFWIA_34890 [Streptomyces sp. NPDC127068]|uniref:hypothetical protein n=1 Tax=Streptomyces sp. NPDC127068 TaxID=3347127 RepID=UPI00365E9093
MLLASLRAAADRVTAPLEFAHAVVRTTLKESGGAVVDLSSSTGLIPRRGSAYGASQAWTRTPPRG